MTIPKRCINLQKYDQHHEELTQLQLDIKVRDLVEPNSERYHQGPKAKPKQYASSRYELLLAGIRKMIGQVPINQYSTDAGNDFTWSLYADNSEPITGIIEFSGIAL